MSTNSKKVCFFRVVAIDVLVDLTLVTAYLNIRQALVTFESIFWTRTGRICNKKGLEMDNERVSKNMYFLQNHLNCSLYEGVKKNVTSRELRGVVRVARRLGIGSTISLRTGGVLGLASDRKWTSDLTLDSSKRVQHTENGVNGHST